MGHRAETPRRCSDRSSITAYSPCERYESQAAYALYPRCEESIPIAAQLDRDHDYRMAKKAGSCSVDVEDRQLREWDPTWAELCQHMALNPWKQEVLPRKTVELIGLV
jgi:hypothetical protein